VIGVVRKWLAGRQNDAIDPKRTFDLKNLWWTRSVNWVVAQARHREYL